jgi:ribosome-binding factor A
MTDRIGKPISQRQLRVGEMIKQSLSMIFIKNEAKVPNLETNTITVTEVRMSQDLKIAKAYVLPLGGKNAEETINLLKEYSFLIKIMLKDCLIISPTLSCLCDIGFPILSVIKSFSQ